MADLEKTEAPPTNMKEQPYGYNLRAPPDYPYMGPDYQPAEQLYKTTFTNKPVGHPGHGQPGPLPRDYFTASIVSIFCFWPTGIFAIMSASKTRSAIARGDMAAAQHHSRSARTMFYVTIGVGVAIWIMLGIFLTVYIGVGQGHTDRK